MLNRIDSYHYSQSYDRDKMYYYENHKYTEDEIEKTKTINEKILEFEKKVRGNDKLVLDIHYPETHIVYFEEKGYISFVNADKDIVDVYYYGRTENEALIQALISYELTYNLGVELHNRNKLNEEYRKRFPSIEIDEDEYHGPFFFSELSLKDFRIYYDDNIPNKVIKYYENYLSEIDGIDYKYDYASDGFILKEKDLVKIKN